jgi:hypothetical protein
MASKNKTTIPTRTQDTFSQIHKVGAQVNWPDGEEVPRTLKHALRLGWVISGSQGEGPDDFSEIGEAHVSKTVGTLCLSIEIPYRSTIKYGKPHTPKARVITETRHFAVVEGQAVELPPNVSGQGMVN